MTFGGALAYVIATECYNVAVKRREKGEKAGWDRGYHWVRGNIWRQQAALESSDNYNYLGECCDCSNKTH